MPSEMQDASVRVIARFRPINKREMAESKPANAFDAGPRDKKNMDMNIDEKSSVISIPVEHRAQPLRFPVDGLLGPNTDQLKAYMVIAKPVVDDVLNGYNGTIFAFGQTGSGKTFTMFGPEGGGGASTDPKLIGVVPRSVTHLFKALAEGVKNEKVEQWQLQCSMLEIYNEKLRDLLNPSGSDALVIKLGKNGDSYVQNLTGHECDNLASVLQLIYLANQNKTVSATLMNATSSRSHSLIIVTVKQKMLDGTIRIGKLNFADLAGSERVKKTGAQGSTLKEANAINQSLSALGNCIKALSAGAKFVPFRDSKLTHILKDSLQGNTKTTLVVAASGHIFNREETISTLRFAQRAKLIKNVVRVNKQLSYAELLKLVKKLQDENFDLRKKLEGKVEKGAARGDKLSKEEAAEISKSLQNMQHLRATISSQKDQMVKLRGAAKLLSSQVLRAKSQLIDKEERVMASAKEASAKHKELQTVEKELKELKLGLSERDKTNLQQTNRIQRLQNEVESLKAILSGAKMASRHMTEEMKKMSTKFSQERIQHQRDVVTKLKMVARATSDVGIKKLISNLKNEVINENVRLIDRCREKNEQWIEEKAEALKLREIRRKDDGSRKATREMLQIKMKQEEKLTAELAESKRKLTVREGQCAKLACQLGMELERIQHLQGEREHLLERLTKATSKDVGRTSRVLKASADKFDQKMMDLVNEQMNYLDAINYDAAASFVKGGDIVVPDFQKERRKSSAGSRRRRSSVGSRRERPASPPTLRSPRSPALSVHPGSSSPTKAQSLPRRPQSTRVRGKRVDDRHSASYARKTTPLPQQRRRRNSLSLLPGKSRKSKDQEKIALALQTSEDANVGLWGMGMRGLGGSMRRLFGSFDG